MKQSIWKRLDLPAGFGEALLLLSLAVLLSPYVAGQDFGVVKIPDFGPSLRRTLQFAGPLIMAIALGVHLPLLSGDANGGPEKSGKFDAQLYLLLGGGHSGPIAFSAYSNHTPSQLADPSMNGPLQLPTSMRTSAARRVYWKEGQRFLEGTKEYGKQGVRSGHTLVLTDQSDPQVVAPILDAITRAKPPNAPRH